MPSPPRLSAHQTSEAIASYPADTASRAVKLFKNGANQAVRIPKEFELAGTDAVMYREGNRLILELAPQKPKKGTLAALVAALDAIKDLGPVTEPFPDVDEGLLALDDIEL